MAKIVNKVKKSLKLVLKPIGVWDALKQGNRVVNRLRKDAINYKPYWKCNTVTLGDEFAQFTIATDYLKQESVVYSVGCGENISFDLEMISKFGVDIYAFDPTPRSINWLKNQKLPEKFRLYELGLASFDGIAYFDPPDNPEYVSFSISKSNTENANNVPAEVRKLSTLMEMLGHDRIDVLKIDIEGSEYDVLEDIVISGLSVGQILVEFHHGIWGISNSATKTAIELLERNGYYIFDVSEEQREFSFLNPDFAIKETSIQEEQVLNKS